MKNPYEVLELKQDATKADIVKARTQAMLKARQRGITVQEISRAEKQLLNPSKRLAADFMYPARLKAKRPHIIEAGLDILPLTINDLDPDALDSLR